MTTISAKSDVMTLINMFTVEPANQRRLVELLTEATEVFPLSKPPDHEPDNNNRHDFF